MRADELRQKFLDFFKERGHTIIPSASLIPENDPTVLFTTAGMQQFKPYYLGEKSPYGQNVVSCQKCFRTSDIDEVGDEKHLTFFEMLGNFSFGGYQKKEAIKLAKDFLDSINIKIDYVTVFGGDDKVPKDEESVKIWRELGFSEEKENLRFCGREDNFWGPTGDEGPCGPTTEIYSQDIEIWNIVFNQYYCHKDKNLTELPIFGVDTGMGFERLVKVSQNVPTIFETDLFEPLIKQIREQYSKKTSEGIEKMFRRIVDHVRGSVFLISDGVFPFKEERGYVLRRILRRTLTSIDTLNLPLGIIYNLAKEVIKIYQDVDQYSYLKTKEKDVLTVIQKEVEKFTRMKIDGEKEFEKIKLTLNGEISGEDAFRLYSTYGFSLEEMKKSGKKVDEDEFWKCFKNHQEISRIGAEQKFKGGLADHSEQTTKYHTATHLLLAAIREILNAEIYQKGSNITAERLRFDFNYPEKLTEEQIKQIEDLVNKKIKEDIAVEMIEMSKDEAIKIAKISFDPSKYGNVVKVYKIDDFSIELCGGPHAERTGILGEFKIIKEESSSAGVRRIKAILR